MRLLTAGRCLLYLAVFIGLSNAIIFDASCARYDAILRKGFSIAFTNADKAQAELTVTPLNSRINEVAGWLFGPVSNFAIAQSRLRKIRIIPSSFTYDKTDKSNSANIVVYCSLSRFLGTRRGFWDRDIGVYNRMSNAQYEGCNTGVSPDGNDPPMVMTTNYEQPGVLTTMDLCVWYLEQILSEGLQTVEDVVDTPGVLQRIDDDGYWSDSDDEDTGMDIATLFDTTILHEMTHSSVVGILQQDSGVSEQYRWVLCTRLKSPYNAESLALFALAVYLMIQGYTVQEDGYLLTAGQTFQRRSLSQEAHRSEYKEDGWNGTGWVV